LALLRHSYQLRGLHFSFLLPVRCSSPAERASSRFWPSLFLLTFMFPIPAIVYARITLALQLFASSIAETILNAFGVPVRRDGNVLEPASQKLSVVEASSAIRSLLSLAFLALVYAYFFDRRVWMRGVLLGATTPWRSQRTRRELR
jgi:exosortase